MKADILTAAELEALRDVDADGPHRPLTVGSYRVLAACVHRLAALLEAAAPARPGLCEMVKHLLDANEIGPIYRDDLEAALAAEVSRLSSAEAVVEAARDMREACVDAYKIGRIPAEPFVRLGNALSAHTAATGKEGA